MSPDSWNIFGQWFRQTTSKPSGAHFPLIEIREAQNLWDFISPEELTSIKRVDLTIFRPGLEPDFAKFMSHETGYILSYKIDADMLINVSTVENGVPRAKLSRTEAKKLKRSGKSASSSESAAHFRVFDPLINAALNCRDSGVKASEADTLPSAIMGFLLKRQYKQNFVQVFIEGATCPYAREIEDRIGALIASALPGIALPSPRKYRLSSYSYKIVTGSSVGRSSRAPRLSPKKIPSHAAVMVEESESVSVSVSESESNEEEEEFEDSLGESEPEPESESEEEEEEDLSSVKENSASFTKSNEIIQQLSSSSNSIETDLLDIILSADLDFSALNPAEIYSHFEKISADLLKSSKVNWYW